MGADCPQAPPFCPNQVTRPGDFRQWVDFREIAAPADAPPAKQSRATLRTPRAEIVLQAVMITTEQKVVTKTVTIRTAECTRCGHVWRIRRQGVPKSCPACHSPYWNKERKHKPHAIRRHGSETPPKPPGRPSVNAAIAAKAAELSRRLRAGDPTAEEEARAFIAAHGL